MKLVIPTYRDRFRLVNPLPLKTYRLQQLDLTDVPSGTVITINRISLNRTSSPDDRVDVLVLASPEPRIAMKKYGGTCEGGMPFSLTIQQLRSLEVEIVEDMP